MSTAVLYIDYILIIFCPLVFTRQLVTKKPMV